MSTITFNGLASGLDSSSMIEQLVGIERAAADAVSTKKSNLESQKSIVNSLSSALSALSTATRALDLDSEIKPRTASVSDARLSVSASAGATLGVHSFRVKSLAVAEVTQSKAFSSLGPGLMNNGGVNITVAGVTKNVSWNNSDTLDSIAGKINNANAGVTASVLQVNPTEYRLVMTASKSGIANAPSFQDQGGGANSAQFSSATNVKVAAADAVVTVDGIDITRSSNTITDAISGLTLNLASVHATTDADARATVSLDNKELTTKVQKVVDAFNAINSALHIQLDYTGTKKGENTLFGDSTLRGLQGALATLTTSSWGTNTTLQAIGITRDKAGGMTLDAAKLSEAVGADPDAVSKIFLTNGFATATTDLVDRYTRADGLLAAKTEALTARGSVLQQQIDRINKSADDLQARLEKQFSALEEAMSKMKGQLSYLSGLFK